MKAYKDLNKTQQCEDGDLVAILEDEPEEWADDYPNEYTDGWGQYFDADEDES